MPLIPLSGYEAFVVLNIVDRPVSLIVADVRRQKKDDVVFTDGETDIDLVPISSVRARTENGFAADDGLHGLGTGGGLACFGRGAEPTGENLYAACLVNEVERTAFKGELLVHRPGVARQKYHRQVHAKLAQSG